MGMAFEITEDDVENVMSKHLKNVSQKMVENAFEEIDHGRVERSALYGNDMDEQTSFALQDIEHQLQELKII